MKPIRAHFSVVILCLASTGLLLPGCAAPPKDKSRGAAATMDTAAVARVPGVLGEFVRNTGCPGATLGVAIGDDPALAFASGYSNLAKRRRMQPSDRMLLGSIGKTFVAAIVLQMVAEGKLVLDQKAADFLGDRPWFDRLPNAPAITIRMLMNHSSGIPEYIFTEEFQAAIKAAPQKVWKPEELLSYIFDAEPAFPPGEGHSYADSNYIVLGIIIEQISGKPYYAVLARRILRPCGLADTSPSNKPDLPGLVSGYTSADNILSVPEVAAADGRYGINPQFEWTGGGLITTSRDLAEWARQLYGGHVVEPRLRNWMFVGRPMRKNDHYTYGLGTMVRQSPHGTAVGHAGYMPGYLSDMVYYPEHDLAVAVQVNTELGVSLDGLDLLLDDVAEVLLGEAGSAAAIGANSTP